MHKSQDTHAENTLKDFKNNGPKKTEQAFAYKSRLIYPFFIQKGKHRWEQPAVGPVWVYGAIYLSNQLIKELVHLRKKKRAVMIWQKGGHLNQLPLQDSQALGVGPRREKRLMKSNSKRMYEKSVEITSLSILNY